MTVLDEVSGLYRFDASGSTGYVTLLWDFGDGETSDQVSVVYELGPGAHTVVLTVSDGFHTATAEWSSEDPDDGMNVALVLAVVLAVAVVAIVVIRRFY